MCPLSPTRGGGGHDSPLSSVPLPKKAYNGNSRIANNLLFRKWNKRSSQEISNLTQQDEGVHALFPPRHHQNMEQPTTPSSCRKCHTEHLQELTQSHPQKLYIEHCFQANFSCTVYKLQIPSLHMCFYAVRGNTTHVSCTYPEEEEEEISHTSQYLNKYSRPPFPSSGGVSAWIRSNTRR